MQTRKVVTSAAFKTGESSSFLHFDGRSRALIVGRRSGDHDAAVGLIGKVIEHSGGSNLLDFGVWCDIGFPHVMGVFGTRGTGKSFDLGVFIESVSGLPGTYYGNLPASATVLFDIQDQFWTLGFVPSPDLVEDQAHIRALRTWGLEPTPVPNVQLWVPPGMSTSLPAPRVLRLSPAQLSVDDWLGLLELDRYSPMGQAMLTLLRTSSSPSEGPHSLAERCQPSGILSGFQSGTVDGLRWRLQAIGETDLVGEPGVDVGELLIPGQTSVLLLRRLPESLRALTVGVLLRLFNHTMSTTQHERKIARRLGGNIGTSVLPERLWVVLDEAHTVVPREGRTAATPAVIDYVKRGRDAGLSLIFATQQPAAVDNRLMSQVDLTLTHALSFESDLQAAEARMPTRSSIVYERAGFALPSLGDVIRSLNPGEALLADANSGRIVAVRIRPRVTAHGGNTPPTSISA